MTSSHIIQCQDVHKSFASAGAKVDVIRGVSLGVSKGEFTVLMGGSGSGKSTLLYLLSGLETHDQGNIEFDGHDIGKMDESRLSLLRREGMGYVFQAFNLVPDLTLLENVLIAGYLGSRSKAEMEEQAVSLLARLGLAELKNRLPSQVSGGEQQRASIARALINAPTVLFADEPTGALNSAAGKTVLDNFASLAEQGQTLFMVTHELRAACYGDRVIYMMDGQVQGEFRFDIPRDEFVQREKQLFSWLTEQGW